MTVAVDAHAHVVPVALLDDVAAGRARFPGVEVRRTDDGMTASFAGGPPTRPVPPGLVDRDRRLAWLDEQGLAHQVMAGWLDVFGYQLEPEVGVEWARALNEAIRAEAATDERLSPLGTVPLQDGAAAAEVLRELRADGVPGVMIATQAGDTELDDPGLEPFWAAADETAAVVYLHPGFRSTPRYKDYGLVNGLARVEDSTVTVARMLYAGIPARCAGARIVVSHGGAAVPFVLGRLQRNHGVTKGLHDPLESFGRLYVDTIVFDPAALRFVLDKVGAERVLLGSDYPFPIGDLAPLRILDGLSLEPGERDAIAGGNAIRLFGLAHVGERVT
jgi:aminocarboxymuconate-semialdehyde decarboxylase